MDAASISLGAFLHPQGSALWTSLVRFPYPGAAGLSALLGLLLPVVINLIIDYRYDGDGKEYAAERAAEESSDLIELLLAESMKRQVHVELSLRSGKSYIGLALKTGLGVNSESDIAIIPMLSGYRRQDTHELEITTDYAPVIWDFLERDDPGFGLAYEDFRVIVPLAEVVSARLFDEDLYHHFQAVRGQAVYPRDW